MEKKTSGEIKDNELRLGYVTSLYYSAVSLSSPKQLDLLNNWFPDLIIIERVGDNTLKDPPEYSDKERLIYATRYHGYLYSGGLNRVTYIIGKLVGTASSNLEKERKAAESIQKSVSRRLVEEMEPIIKLVDHIRNTLSLLNDDQINRFHENLYEFTLDAAEKHYSKEEHERDGELFPFDEEVFDQIIYNAFYQLTKYDFVGLTNAFLWLLLGGLLRNECGRICRVYDSSFIPVNKPASETGHLLDKLNYLIAPEEYESFYTGDDMEKRFPGVEWFCNQCNAHLNEQDNFDDHLDVWQCRRCGYLNPIDAESIYENEEDYKNNIHRESKEDLMEAIGKRNKELKKE